MTRRRRISPAALALAGAGFRQLDLAHFLDRDPSTVAHELAGRKRLDPRMRDALVAVVGDDELADRILALVPAGDHREAAVA